MSISPAPSTEDYVLFADKRKMNSGLNKRMLLFCVPMVLFMFIVIGIFDHGIRIPLHHPSRFDPSSMWIKPSPHMGAILNWIPWFLLAECAFLWWIVGRSHRKQAKPIVVLTPQGITVDTMATHLGELTWDEVGQVRSYTLIYRYVGIVPTDTAALSRRLGGRRAWLLRMNAACAPLYKLFGQFTAPINIPQVYLPITAEELEAKIRTYQSAYGPRSAFGHGDATDGTVWPPPPTNVRG